MRVKVKLFTTLSQGRQKELDYQLAENATVQDLISVLDLEGQEVSIIVVNGKDASKDRPLQDGDVISIFPPLGGG